MANVIRGRTIQYTDRDGRRRTLGLAKIGLKQRQFDGVLLRVDDLVAAQISRQPLDPETARWLGEIGAPLADKLAKAGLIAPRASAKLGTFIDEYISGRCDLKSGTKDVLEQTRHALAEFFGEGKPLREITAGDADQWRLHLIELGLRSSTVARRVKHAKQLLKAALRRGLVTANPFADLKTTAVYDPSKFRFVTRAEAAKILTACPDAEWRLIFALCRFGGLRCPSEVLALRWSDVNFDERRILVHSPKTEHHEGGESRLIPMFPELEKYLLEVFSQPGPADYVITRYRDSRANLRTQFNRIVVKAGLQPWPKPFINLRSTRETELAEVWPEHVVVGWIGNSVAVARKHYLQTTDKHFQEAAAGTREKALHQALQHTSAQERTAAHRETENRDCSELQTVASSCSDDSYGDRSRQDSNL